MTLALLLTAVGGAWAQDVDGTIAWSVGNEASATVSASIKDAISSTGVTTGSGLTVESGNYFETNMVKYTPATANAGNVSGVMIEYTIEAVDGYKFKPTGVDYAAVKVGADSPTYSWSYTIDGVESAITDVSYTSVLRNNGNNSGTAQLMHNESITADGCSVFTLRFYISNCGTTKNICIGNITISGSVSVAPASDVEVTTNKAEGETTFTEASFNMPAFDATAEYELVRDMTVDVDATIADRIRIKKENNVYLVVTDGQLTPAVSDKISGTAVAMTATTDYTVQLQKKTEGDTPTWADATTLSVGTFRYVITGTGLYDGNITTNEFQLFEGYEVTIPAGEYATFYKDENLYTEDENAELYTIASVTDTEAVLSSQINKVAAYTPMLIFNKGTEANTFLLIPTTEQADEVTVAKEFKGSLTEGEIPASSAVTDYYALNGKAFVWVKYAIEIGANKCWLQIGDQPAAARAMTRSIVGGNGTTGIDAIENVTIDNEGWYDLQGRKLQSAPNRKGIYIHNGRKVVVH